MANTVWGSLKAKASNALSRANDYKHKVLNNLVYFWTFDANGNVEHSGEMRLTSNGKWSGPITDKTVEITLYSKSPGSPSKRVKLGEKYDTHYPLHATFEKTTPKYLYVGDDASKVMFVLHSDKNMPVNRSAVAQLASSMHGGVVQFVPTFL